MLNIAVVGSGFAAPNHIAAAGALGDVRITAFVDIDPARAQELAAGCGAGAFASLREALPHCDAVAVCTPPSTHRAIACEAMEAGKSVLVEKPFSDNLADAHAMLDCALRTGAVLMTAFNNRFRDGFIRLRDTIASGELGRLQSFYIHRQGMGLIRSGQESWRAGSSAVCGQAIESLSHDLDILRFCVGDVKAVGAFTLCSLPFAPDYDNNAAVAMELRCGAVANLYSCWDSRLGFAVRGACGAKGAASLTGPSNWELREFHLRTDDMPHEEVILLREQLDSTGYIREYRAFADAALGYAALPVGMTDGLKVLEISLAILESSRTGKIIYLD